MMAGGDVIALAGAPQGHFDIADAVNAVGRDPTKRNNCATRSMDHSQGERWLEWSVRALDRYNAGSNERVTVTRHAAQDAPIWQFVFLLADPVYCCATPRLALFREPVSSTTRTAS
jgi:hypothetical protein